MVHYGAIWIHMPSLLPLRLGRLSSSARRRCCSPPMGLGEAKLATATKNIGPVRAHKEGFRCSKMFKIDTANSRHTLTLKQFQTLHVHCILQPVDLNVEKLCRLEVVVFARFSSAHGKLGSHCFKTHGITWPKCLRHLKLASVPHRSVI